MTFLNPFLLFGIGAIAAPIIIHMFMNRKIKPVVWAAMRFLKVSVQKNQKRMNLEDILLLILRCLILALLALALARPAFRGAGGALKGSETAVIALDNSFSMGQNDGAETRFDQGRKAAEQVIDSLPAGSSVAVFLFSDVVRAAIPEPAPDLNLARKIIRDSAVSDRPTDVQTVLKQATDVLARHAGGSPRVYLITDGQAAGWKKFDDIGKMLRNPAVKTRVILVGGTEEHNLSVSGLEMASSMASVGEAAQFEVEVSNFGTSDAKSVAARLSIDGETPSDEGVIETIPPGAAKHLSLFAKFTAAGYHTVTAQIDADHLRADDQRTIALRAMDDVRVLLVTGDTSPDPAENALFYLRNALTPAPFSAREKYVVKTKTISPGELDSTKLDDYEAVVFANVPNVSRAALDALGPYLSRGGGLIIFPGPKTDTTFYNDNFAKKLGMLPATFGAMRGKPDQRDAFFSLQTKDYAHRIVSIWNDPAAGTLGTAHFYAALELKPEPVHAAQAGEPQIVLKYADGAPAVMERTWGRGRVIMFSSTANAAWNDLPLRRAYLPLMDRTLGAILDRQDARLNIPVGGVFEFVCDSDWVGKDALIAAAGDQKESGSLRRIGIVDGLPLLRFEETEKAGPYDATIKTDPPTVVKFAAQFNPDESKLASLTQTQLDSLAPDAQVVRWTPGASLGGQIAGGGSGGEWWTILATLVLVIACAEVALGGIFSATK